jgi:hypothetical protein
VVFSRGCTGCGLQSVSFTEELARNGFVVAAPDYTDAAICHIVPPGRAAKHSFSAQPNIIDPVNGTNRLAWIVGRISKP